MNAAPIERPASRDRFHPSYVISAFLFVLYCDVLLTLSRTTGDDAIAFFLVLLPGTLTLIVWLCCTGWILVERHWRRAVSLFAAPLLALMPFQALGHFGIDGDWLRFEYEKSGFLKGVAESVAFNGHPVLIHWFCGMVGGGFGTSAQIWVLIYDETDHDRSHRKVGLMNFEARFSKPMRAMGRTLHICRALAWICRLEKVQGLTLPTWVVIFTLHSWKGRYRSCTLKAE
ncbi:hypothetical protein ACQZ4Y_19810 [Rhizobium sp. L80/93]|uniref:hypothetical protein n=1 Tax=Rhizobium sp. E27B/91 TaxID=2819995 RepID=UPI001ADA6750|nr:hypothetical protein [Rhizobium sp. E27B/91]MBO9188089.1 hypothetical protein [Rhizobium sp. E27B/91]